MIHTTFLVINQILTVIFFLRTIFSDPGLIKSPIKHEDFESKFIFQF